MTYWKDSLLVGVLEIDREHRKLVAAIDDLMEACAKWQGRAAIEKTLLFVESYTKTHFADEERLQAQYAYPGASAHKKIHTQFIATVSAMVADFKESGPNIALVATINKTLVEWLIQHIGSEDKMLGDFINSKVKRD